jgi:hypothetical protein
LVPLVVPPLEEDPPPVPEPLVDPRVAEVELELEFEAELDVEAAEVAAALVVPLEPLPTVLLGVAEVVVPLDPVPAVLLEAALALPVEPALVPTAADDDAVVAPDADELDDVAEPLTAPVELVAWVLAPPVPAEVAATAALVAVLAALDEQAAPASAIPRIAARTVILGAIEFGHLARPFASTDDTFWSARSLVNERAAPGNRCWSTLQPAGTHVVHPEAAYRDAAGVLGAAGVAAALAVVGTGEPFAEADRLLAGAGELGETADVVRAEGPHPELIAAVALGRSAGPGGHLVAGARGVTDPAAALVVRLAGERGHAAAGGADRARPNPGAGAGGGAAAGSPGGAGPSAGSTAAGAAG